MQKQITQEQLTVHRICLFLTQITNEHTTKDTLSFNTFSNVSANIPVQYTCTYMYDEVTSSRFKNFDLLPGTHAMTN